MSEVAPVVAPGRVANGDEIEAWTERLGAALAAGDESKPITLAGIPRRGHRLAERLGAVVRRHGRACSTIAVDPTLWRDDFDAAAHRIELSGSVTPSDVEGRHLVLVDDVLMTGRTVRAALDHLMLLGRPARVQLAVYVDRGGREVPIQPDHVAIRLDLPREWHVQLQVVEVDGDEGVFVDAGGAE